MSSISFPSSPQTGDNFLTGGAIYRYDGARWVSLGAAFGGRGEQGPPGPQGIQGPQGEVGPAGSDANVTFFEQGECSQPYVAAYNSEDQFQTGGFAASSFTAASANSWEYTRLGNKVTVTGYLHTTTNLSFGGSPAELALYWDPYDNAPFSYQGPPAPSSTGFTIPPQPPFIADEHPLTPCAPFAINIATSYAIYSQVHNASERPFIADGDVNRLAVKLFRQNTAGSGKTFTQILTNDINVVNAKLGITIVYYTEDRVYGGVRPF